MQPLVLVRPQPLRLASAATLAVILAWASLSADISDFAVLAYPAIIALQTAREWWWRLELTPKGVHERPGVGAARTVPWTSVTAVLMPDAAWWRLNPVLQVDGAANVQMTAGDGVAEVIAAARQKRIPVVGTAESISLVRSLTPWLILLGLACLMVGLQLASRS